MFIEELLATQKGHPDAKIFIGKVTSKSDQITNDTLFFLLPGVKEDTSVYLPFILSKRPAAIVTEHGVFVQNTQIPCFSVQNVRRAYANAIYRATVGDLGDIRFFGVTGTNGKTSTATLLRDLLISSGRSVGSFLSGKIEANGKQYSDTHYSMTTPDPEIFYPTVKQMKDAGVTDIVMELSSHASVLEKLSPVNFRAIIFLNLSPEHLDFHGNMENYYKAKKKYFASTDTAIINIDDPWGKRLACELRDEGLINNLITFGAVEDADVRMENLIFSPERPFEATRFSLRYQGLFSCFSLSLIGKFQLYNATAAAICAMTEKIPGGVIRRVLSSARAIPGRMEILSESPLVLIDYAHTEDAFENCIKYLYSIRKSGQKLFVIFGAGGERDKNKRPKYAEYAEKYADFTIVTCDNPRSESPFSILRDICAGFSENASYRVISDRKDALIYALSQLTKNDILAVIGKGAEPYVVDRDGYKDYNEREILSAMIATWKENAE